MSNGFQARNMMTIFKIFHYMNKSAKILILKQII